MRHSETFISSCVLCKESNIYDLFTTLFYRRVKSSTLLNSDFEFTAGDPKSEAVNNAITCVSIKVEVSSGVVVHIGTFIFVPCQYYLLWFQRLMRVYSCVSKKFQH